MSRSPLELAQQLVTLATDPGATKSEAESAAVAACKLIRKHNLLSPPSADEPFAAHVARGIWVNLQADGLGLEEILRTFAGEFRRPWAQQRPPPTARPPPPRPAPPPPPPRRRSPPRPVDPQEREMRIRSTMSDIRSRLRQSGQSMPEEKIRSAAAAAVDAAIAQGL